jgi:hypothetical protein
MAIAVAKILNGCRRKNPVFSIARASFAFRRSRLGALVIVVNDFRDALTVGQSHHSTSNGKAVPTFVERGIQHHPVAALPV